MRSKRFFVFYETALFRRFHSYFLLPYSPSLTNFIFVDPDPLSFQRYIICHLFTPAETRIILFKMRYCVKISLKSSLIHKKLVRTYFFITCLKINIFEWVFFLLKGKIIIFKTVKTVSLKNDWQKNENSMNRGHFDVRTFWRQILVD